MSELFRPDDPEVQRNPYPIYRRLREEAPIYRAEFDDGSGAVPLVVLSQYEDCLWLLRDPRFSAEKDFDKMFGSGGGGDADTGSMVARFFDALMLFRDPPDHTRLRTLVNKAFTPRRVESLRPRIQTLLDELIAASVAKGGMDLIHDIAAPLPVLVIAELLGVPTEDHAQLKRWSDDAAPLIDGSIRRGSLDQGIQSLIAFGGYVASIIEQRKSARQDDLISALVTAQDHDDRLTDEEILATCLLILAAGHETTTNLIGNGMKALIDHEAQQEHLRARPDLVRGAVDEVLRFDSPVQATSRRATEDVMLRGEKLAAGMEVNALIGSANRDPLAFPSPDDLVVERKAARHLSFGHGTHFCLGAPLARLEGEIAIGTLTRRLRGLRLVGEPKRRPGFVLRGYESLPVSFDALEEG